MAFRTVPFVTTRYWAAITLASIVGANLGDFVSHDLHMGHLRGIPYIAAAFALVGLGSALARRPWEGWYWLAIVATRTIATNLADLATHDGALATLPVCAVLAAILLAILRLRPDPALGHATAARPRAGTTYWLAMLTAGTLGTALGDGIADQVTLPLATILAAAAVLLALALRARHALGPIAAYWLAIVAIRTFGTNAGDLIAHRWSLAVTTPLTGIALLALLVLWRERPAIRRRLGFTAAPASES